MEHYSRSYRDLLQWNPILKKTYFEYHPTDKKMYRTYQPVFRPFGGMNDEGRIQLTVSNWVYGTPDENTMTPYHPSVASAIRRMQPPVY